MNHACKTIQYGHAVGRGQRGGGCHSKFLGMMTTVWRFGIMRVVGRDWKHPVLHI